MATQEAAIDSRSEAVASTETFDTIVIGGGQAGLSVGYHLARRGRSFVILDANQRIGDTWRNRWDSLRLFTRGRSGRGTAHRRWRTAVSWTCRR